MIPRDWPQPVSSVQGQPIRDELDCDGLVNEVIEMNALHSDAGVAAERYAWPSEKAVKEGRSARDLRPRRQKPADEAELAFGTMRAAERMRFDPIRPSRKPGRMKRLEGQRAQVEGPGEGRRKARMTMRAAAMRSTICREPEAGAAGSVVGCSLHHS